MMRSAVLACCVLLSCGCNAGTAPPDYGALCDPSEEDACSDGLECVPAMHTRDFVVMGDYRCSAACEVDADCPAAEGCIADENPPITPYPCYADGYCEIWLCGN